jgi:ferritin-like metal-binding protein YciE
MADESLQDIYVEQLKDLWSAENQLLRALPKMAKGAASPNLRSAFEEHEVETRVHVERLDRIFQQLGEKGSGHKCKGMEGLIAEGDEVLEEHDASVVRDAALIAAAQRVEHYEIAGYGTVRTRRPGRVAPEDAGRGREHGQEAHLARRNRGERTGGFRVAIRRVSVFRDGALCLNLAL